jgi:tetratricopeptide (TPR) repeat protein
VFADAPGFVKWGEAGGARQSRQQSSDSCRSLDELSQLSLEAVALYSKAGEAEEELAGVELAISVTFSTLRDVGRAAELVADAEPLLIAAGDDPATRAMRAFATGRLAFLEDRYTDAEDAFRVSLDLLTANAMSAHESHALRYAARLATVRGAHADAIDALERACAIAQTLGLSGFLNLLLGELGEALSESGDADRARAVLGLPLAWAREFGFLRGISESLTGLAITEWRAGAAGPAALYAQEGLDTAREIDHLEAAACCATILGWASGKIGDLGRARSCQLDALQIANEAASPRAMAFALESLAETELLEHDGQRAARLLGAASVLRKAPGAAIGFAFAVGARADVDVLLDGIHDDLDRETAADAFAEGANESGQVIGDLLHATA